MVARRIGAFAVIGSLLLAVACSKPTQYAMAVATNERMIGIELKKTLDFLLTVSTSEDKASLMQLNDGKVQLAMVQSQSAQLAYSGQAPYIEGSMQGLNTIVQLYPQTLQLVMRGSTDEFLVLKQKRMAVVGEKDGVAALSAPIVLDALAIPIKEVEIQVLSDQSALAAFKKGEVDALMTCAALPDATVEKALSSNGSLIEIPAQAATALKAVNASLSACTLPRKAYKQNKDIPTFALRTVILCSQQLSTQSARSITESLIIKKSGWLVPDAANQAPIYPYHPGAREALDAYYQQQKPEQK